MTRKEALEKGRKIREEKLFRKLYEDNKALINQKGAVTFSMFEARVKKAWGDNPRYSEVKSLVGAGRKMLHTLEYISKDQIGIENIKAGLKSMKTGRKIKWGKTIAPTGAQHFGADQPTVYFDKYREETMFDVFRRLVGVGHKFDIYWNEDSKTYRFIGQNNLEYEIIVKTSPVSYGIQLVNA